MTGETNDGQGRSDTDGTGISSDERKFYYIWSKVFETLIHAITGAVILGIAFFFFQVVQTLAGKDTSIWASLSLAKSNYGFPWALACVLLTWALSERKLRQRKTSGMEGHIRDLETGHDPERTSSGLLPTGKTNPKDK